MTRTKSGLVLLTPRWYPLRVVPEQLAFANSMHRFNAVTAGRRSGKTEHVKRKLIMMALNPYAWGIEHGHPARFFAAAPTHAQAKAIYWEDLKALVPKRFVVKISESEKVIRLINGSEIYVIGLDVPARIEGSPWDYGVLDEYGNMKPEAWPANVRPALSDRNGKCDVIGVPEGRNHYYDLWMYAVAQQMELGDASEWGAFTWHSSLVIDPREVEQARHDLDALTFSQEYEGSFVNFEGQAYYGFKDDNKAKVRSLYDPQQPLIICLDFNVAPGVACIVQEHGGQTCVIGEVWIERNSNTPAVCRKLLADWSAHQGRVDVYGDATGGASGSAKVDGSDWDIVRERLRNGFDGMAGFGGRLNIFVKPGNPDERVRINAVNSRLRSADGTVRLLVDPSYAPHVVRDLEGVRTLKGGSGEIDKKHDLELTHISDALGYYVEYRFPIVKPQPAVVRTMRM